MEPDVRVVEHEIFIYEPATVKLYTFDNWQGDAEVNGRRHPYLRRCLDEVLMAGAQNNEPIAPAIMVAFLYGYEKDNKNHGADIFHFREHNAPNSMIDSWTYENGVYISREKGTMCGTEAILLAEEEKLRRAHLGNLELWLASWPTNLP